MSQQSSQGSAQGKPDEKRGKDKKSELEKKPSWFRRTLWKVKERVGTTEKTSFGKDFLDAEAKYDHYFRLVEQYVERVESVLQPNPELQRRGELETRPGQDPWEKLAEAVAVCKVTADADRTNQVVADLARHLGTLHRDTQRRGKHAIHRTRVFVANDHHELTDMRHELNIRRQAMDQARIDLERASTDKLDARGAALQVAVDRFDDQAEKVLARFDTLNDCIVAHKTELVRFINVIRVQHAEGLRYCDEALASLKR